jgi:hypothetical protein
MGITIEAIDDKPHPPFAVRVELECEAGDGASLLCKEREVFKHANGYIGCHGLAMAAGWLERQTPAGRAWICPECSGK